MWRSKAAVTGCGFLKDLEAKSSVATRSVLREALYILVLSLDVLRQ